MGKVTLPRGFDPKLIKHWYVVANRIEALIYEGQLNGSFRFVRRMKNAKGKLTELELVADRPGRSFASSRSKARHAYEPHSLYHEVVAQKFAKRIARELEKAVLAEDCTDLVVMAEPHFLGLLNHELPKRVKALVRREVAREWSQGSDRELEDYLRKKLA